MTTRNIYLTSTVDTSATQFACEHLRNFTLTDLKEVKITPTENDGVMVSFFFETYPDMFMQIDVVHAFCVGYHGEGPSGLHNLMIDAGFSEHTASRVFEISRYAETVLTK